MARYRKSGGLGRLILLVLLNVALVLAGLVWFDFLGVLDASWLVDPVAGLFGADTASAPAISLDDPRLLDEERFGKRLESLSILKDELLRKEGELTARTEEISQMAQELEERQGALEEREKSFNREREAIENKEANLARNAQYLTSMPPKQAVDILVAMADQDVVDLLRLVDKQAEEAGKASLVPAWLMAMPPERAATIQRKMAGRPAAP
jgi:flagellar protein FlbB